MINGRIYIFSNLSQESAARKESQAAVKIVDLNLKSVFRVDLWQAKPENRPSTIRVNYSIANYKHKVYFYGGLDSENKILSTIEEFDATTYKFNVLKMRGDYQPKGRQAHSAIAVDQYNMLIIGGSFQASLIDPSPIGDDQGNMLLYDMDSSTF